MSYKKYLIMMLFENLYYTPLLSDTNTKVFEFDL